MPDEPAAGDAAGLRAANARLRALLADREAEIAERDALITVLRGQLGELTALQAEASGLRERAAELEAQVADLAARVGMNSQNSSKPPSSDGLGKPAPKSLRPKTGRKPGRPKGQAGATMQLSDNPGRVFRHEPSSCSGCAAGLGGTLEEGVTAPVQYGPRAAAVAAYLRHGQFLSRDRACQAMADLSGCAPPPGALASMARKIAAAVAPSQDAVRGALASAGVAHFDETGFRVAGRLAWVHSASSGKYVLVTVHAKRGKDGMNPAGILPAFAGIACHDAWAPYDCYSGVAGHALCAAEEAVRPRRPDLRPRGGLPALRP